MAVPRLQHAKSIAYKAIVRPCLEYASVVWSPHTVSDIDAIESVQKRAARWICARWGVILMVPDCLHIFVIFFGTQLLLGKNISGQKL